MGVDLVVARPFAGHAVGEVIADPAEVAAVLADERGSYVVRRHAATAAPPAPHIETVAEAVAAGVLAAEAALHPAEGV